MAAWAMDGGQIMSILQLVKAKVKNLPEKFLAIRSACLENLHGFLKKIT